MTLITCYRANGKVVLWEKNGRNTKLEVQFEPVFYVDNTHNIQYFLRKLSVTFFEEKKNVCWGEERIVLRITTTCQEFERHIREIERHSDYRIGIYNADIKPELQYVYDHDLTFLEDPQMNVLEIDLDDGITYSKSPVTQMRVNDAVLEGSELHVLQQFVELFGDPDVIRMRFGARLIPYLNERMQFYGLSVPWHRWDAYPIRYRGGRSFFRYGLVTYHDWALRLRGRILVDTKSMMGDAPLEGLWELSRLASERPEYIASRSAGAVFQLALIREMYKEGFLIPYKQKPPGVSISLAQLVKADRGGHTLDPLVGKHDNVAQLDFFSLFPVLMARENISAECVLSREEPLKRAPGLTIEVSHAQDGLVSRTLRPFISLRRQYKQDPTPENKRRAAALKGVLVSANGYLRFREFKLGLSRTHMALCAHAREVLMRSKEIAEEMGFTVVHGIVDCLFVKKKDMTESDVEELRKTVEEEVQVPLELEGIYRWVRFLRSKVDPSRPVPARYYGVFVDGTIKARGLEVRQRSSPPLVKKFQQECLEMLRQEEVAFKVKLQEYSYRSWDIDELVLNVRIGREEYSHNVPQKEIFRKLKAQGVTIQPGQVARFVKGVGTVYLPNEKNIVPDKEYYQKLLRKSLDALELDRNMQT